jgi:hypothetical protein
MKGGETRFLGGSDPTFGGLQPPNAFRRRGSLPPNLLSRLVGSVAAEPAKKTVAQFELQMIGDQNDGSNSKT